MRDRIGSKTTFQKRLNRLVLASLVERGGDGLYRSWGRVSRDEKVGKRRLVNDSWARDYIRSHRLLAKETSGRIRSYLWLGPNQSFNLSAQKDLRESTELLFNNVYVHYKEILSRLVFNVHDAETANEVMDSFITTIAGPLLSDFAIHVWRNRTKVPLQTLPPLISTYRAMKKE